MMIPVLLAASQALLSVVDPNAAKGAFADFTNNVTRIEAVDDAEWSASNSRYALDLVAANAPFHLVIGPGAQDRSAADLAVETVATSMPAHVRTFFTRHGAMGPVTQWLLRRHRTGVATEADYVSPKAHGAVWTAKDFDLPALAKAAGALASNTVPLVVNVMSVYAKEYPESPILRATPVVDYPDPRPEVTFETPCAIGIVLRAIEARRKFRFAAFAGLESDTDINFKWITFTAQGSSFGASVRAIDAKSGLTPERGFAEVEFDWRNLRGRMDVAVFARHGEGPYGVPSIISFFPVPNERRAYESDGTISHIEYAKTDVPIPQLYQNKAWRDDYIQDSNGYVVGFKRLVMNGERAQRFSIYGQFIVEAYPNDTPRIARRVRYFTKKGDPETLHYEIFGDDIPLPLETFVPKSRGEFPVATKKRGRW